MSTSLRINREERVLRLTLARPEKRNALSEDLCRALVEACESAFDDPSTGAILIDSEGPVFCAGMDLDEVLDPQAAARTAIHTRLFTLAERATKPIIAAVQGPALGGGVGLVANAHIVLAAQGVSFGLTELRIGMWPFVIYRAVANAIGERRTLELTLTTRIFNLNEALSIGLVHEITPAFELDDRATAVAQQLAGSSADAVTRGMEFLRGKRGLPAGQALELAASLRTEQFASPDFQEGVLALREKRRPIWPSIQKI